MILRNFKEIFMRNKRTTILFLFGTIMSILMLSISTSGIITIQDLESSREFINLQDLYDVNVITSTEIEKSKMVDIIKNVTDSGVVFYGMQSPVDGFNHGMTIHTYIEYSNIEHEIFPIFSGIELDKNDMLNKTDYVMVGKSLEDYTYKSNGANYISLAGLNYNVKAFIGQRGRRNFADSSLVFTFGSIPDMVWSAQSSTNRLQFKVFSPLNKSLENIEQISIGIKRVDKEAQIVYEKVNLNRASFFSLLPVLIFRGGFEFIFFALLVYIVSVLNSINISVNWIKERRYEIGVRKAFGHSHFNIFTMIYFEMLSIFLVSGIIASVLHILLIQLLQSRIESTISFSIEILVVSLIMIFITSFITSIVPVIKTFSIQPKEAMQG